MDNKYIVLWEAILNNTELTTKNLKELGYQKPSRLVETGILKRIKRGFYELDNIREFSYYGMSLKDHNNEKYYEVMVKCLELDPNFGSAIFQIFVYNLRKKDYYTALEYLTKLIEAGNPSYQKDYNLYLLILSRIIKLPDNYQEKVNKLNVFDIYAPNTDKRFLDRTTENKIRKAFYEGDYGLAIRLSSMHSSDGYPKIVYFQFLKAFLKKEPKAKPYSNLEAAKNHDYDAIKKHLESLETLNSKNKMLYRVVTSYLEIASTGIIPEVTPYKVKRIDYMINANDFEAAYNLVQTDPNCKEYSIYYLLEDIHNLINKITFENNKVYTFDDILTSLTNNDNYLNVLRRYLTQNNKSEYESLLLSFIKLGIYEEDFSYMVLFRHLSDLMNNRLNINFVSYHKYFKEAISSGCLEEASIYLDIIKSGNKLGLNNIDISSLEYSLSKAEIKLKRDKMIATITTALDEVENARGIAILDSGLVPFDILNSYLTLYNVIAEQIKDKIVLRYFKHQYIDIKYLIDNAINASRNADYETCINNCLTIINCVRDIKPLIYQLLGTSYYRLGILEEAKKYLTIADLKGKYDNKMLIKKINNILEEENSFQRILKKTEDTDNN